MSIDVAEYLLRHGDDALVHGHRLSEWCAHAPALEEDLALTNIALDCLGQAQALLTLAGSLLEPKKSADELVYLRDSMVFRNVQLVELPSNSDFGVMIAKQFLFDSYRFVLFSELKQSSFEPLAAIAAKSLKEITYHLRHSSSWIVRLGDGTEISHERISNSLSALWSYVGELFADDDLEQRLAAQKVCPLRSSLRTVWNSLVTTTLREATLELPQTAPRYPLISGWNGIHTEHLGRMLAEMQILARSYPNVNW